MSRGGYFALLMLVFDVRSLAVQAAKVDGALPPDDAIWMAEDVRPAGPLAVTGRVSTAGRGRFYFSGRFSGAVRLECRRCLAPVEVAVTNDVAALFSDEEGEDAGDPDVFALADGGRNVDVRSAVREAWLLNVPAFAQCREDCRGICPTCGTDLNTGTCSCEPVTDSRWDALRALRGGAKSGRP